MKKSHLLIGVFCGLAIGCDNTTREVAPVYGIVTVDSKPLFQGRVLFAPVAKGDDMNPGKPAMGKIQEDGKYRLTTYQENDGAIIGEHWVTIINSEEDLPDGVPEFARLQVPEKVTVAPSKDNEINIELTRDVVKKYAEDDR